VGVGFFACNFAGAGGRGGPCERWGVGWPWGAGGEQIVQQVLESGGFVWADSGRPRSREFFFLRSVGVCLGVFWGVWCCVRRPPLGHRYEGAAKESQYFFELEKNWCNKRLDVRGASGSVRGSAVTAELRQ